MTRATTTLVLTTAALLFAGSSAVAQNEIDLSGKDCAEKATQLRDIIERNAQQNEEAERLDSDVTRALARCRNGDEEAFAELATRFEMREWNITEERMDN